MSVFSFYNLHTFLYILCSILYLQELSCVSPTAADAVAVAAAAAATAEVVVAAAAAADVVAAAAVAAAAVAADVVAAVAVAAAAVAAAAIAADADAAGVKFLSHSHTGPVVASHTGDTKDRGEAFYSLINILYSQCKAVHNRYRDENSICTPK
jgi:hypothetical protein